MDGHGRARGGVHKSPRREGLTRTTAWREFFTERLGLSGYYLLYLPPQEWWCGLAGGSRMMFATRRLSYDGS
jgi:hypothetical protein